MDVKQGQRYRHFKGNTYVVIALGLHTETGERLVVYQGEYDDPEFGLNPIWIRPHDMFEEHVLVEGQWVPRFTPLP
jgi:hypothetical protein